MVVAPSDHSQHERVRPVVLDYLVLQSDRHIELLDRAGEQRRLPEHYVRAVYLHKVFGLS